MSKFKEYIGNIKRKYTEEDFNPYTVMSFVYNTGISSGVGSTVSLVGFGERFKKDLPKAWWHVMIEKGIITNKKAPPIPVANQFKTHTGAIIRFVLLPDQDKSQAIYKEVCESSDMILLCSEYKQPVIKSMSRYFNSTKRMYDFSKNVKKEVDTTVV